MLQGLLTTPICDCSEHDVWQGGRSVTSDYIVEGTEKDQETKLEARDSKVWVGVLWILLCWSDMLSREDVSNIELNFETVPQTGIV